jgi:hypothetical protein
MHDAVTVGVPLLAIPAGILFNRSDVAGKLENQDGFAR